MAATGSTRGEGEGEVSVGGGDVAFCGGEKRNGPWFWVRIENNIGPKQFKGRAVTYSPYLDVPLVL